jgi:hypothetical protein
MTFTIQAQDLVLTALACVGVVLMFSAGLTLLLTFLGQRLPEVEERLAFWLMRDASGWRARRERKAEWPGPCYSLMTLPQVDEEQ